MISRSTLFLMVFLILSNSSFAEKRTITLVADKWCPFNCSDEPEDRGILVEMAAKALAGDGVEINYIEVPWTRAIIGVRDGEYDGIIGTGLTETPDFHFPPHPLATARHSFFTLPSSTWEYKGLASLKELRLGVIQDYSYGTLYENYIKSNRNDSSRLVILRGNKVLPRLVRMLELGRIDALVAEEQVLDYHFASRGQVNPLRNAGLANEEHLYIAFSPALAEGPALAEALGRGLVKMYPAP